MQKIILLIILIPHIAWAQVIDNIDSHGVLKSGGLNLSLAGVMLKDGAVDYMKNNWQGREVIIEYGEKKQNRYGNELVQVRSKDGDWLQGELVKSNLALAYPTLDNDVMAKEILAIESQIPLTDLQLKENLEEYKGSLQIVQGVVYEVKKVRDKMYINFEDDWKQDFTVLIRKKNFKRFDGVDFDLFKGQKIRVRGWVESYNGPMIEIYNKWHMQLL